MSTDPAHEDWFPLDDDEHERQLAGLLDLLGDSPARVVDLGCGDGRVATPLAEAGHDVLCLDNDPAALERCAARGLETRRTSFLDPAADLSHPRGPANAVLCLGNTLLTVHQPERALALLAALRPIVAPDGALLIDDFSSVLWREISEGYWQIGLSEDGDAQLVWAPGDNVIAIRRGDAIDIESDEVRESDTPLRIWSSGELRLAALATGWSGPDPLHERFLARFLPA